MNVVVVYVYPGNDARNYESYVMRFLESYHSYPAGHPHQSVVVIPKHLHRTETLCLFSVMENLILLEHDNSGWDIGAFQLAAQTFPQADLMLFFGTTTWIKGFGWLRRVVESFEKHGDALYGAMGNRGNTRIGVYPHIRTTGFWVRPEHMNQYPVRILRPEQRYPFEHGKDSFTQFMFQSGKRAFVVSWTSEYEMENWDSIPNGYHRGDQTNMLFGDRHSDPPFHPVP